MSVIDTVLEWFGLARATELRVVRDFAQERIAESLRLAAALREAETRQEDLTQQVEKAKVALTQAEASLFSERAKSAHYEDVGRSGRLQPVPGSHLIGLRVPVDPLHTREQVRRTFAQEIGHALLEAGMVGFVRDTSAFTDTSARRGTGVEVRVDVLPPEAFDTHLESAIENLTLAPEIRKTNQLITTLFKEQKEKERRQEKP